MIEYLKLNLQYAKYLVRHKFFVFHAGLVTGAPIARLIIHDWSKFLPSEWPQYRDNFYPPAITNGEQVRRIERRFNQAWNRHIHRNPHHWQYWATSNDNGTYTALEMPEKYVQEMVADWWGAGRAITGKWDAVTWFIRNGDFMRLHPNTRKLIVQILDKSSKIILGVTALA